MVDNKEKDIVIDEEVKVETPKDTEVKEVEKVEETEVVEETKEVEKPITIEVGSEEYNKAIQSASSKAKNDILKALGGESVESLKEKISRGDELDNVNLELVNLRQEIDYIRKEKASLENELLITNAGIPSELKDEFITLLENDNSGDDKLTILLKLKEKFNITNVAEKVVIGNGGKTHNQNKTEAELMAELRKL